MSSDFSLPCYDHVSPQPDDPEIFENVPIQRHQTSKLNFGLKLCVRFQKRCSCRQIITDIFNIPPLLSSHYISCNEFFQNGPSFLRRNLLFYDVVTSEVLDELMPSIMFRARKLFDSYDHRDDSSNNFEDGLVFPLAIGVYIELPMDVDIEDVVEVIVSEYMQEIKMIPASEEVIQSLNKIKFQEGFNSQCCICLEDFHQSMEVSAMPCHHIFHHNCVAEWLKTSHLCPLCRYQMPTINNS